MQGNKKRRCRLIRQNGGNNEQFRAEKTRK